MITCGIGGKDGRGQPPSIVIAVGCYFAVGVRQAGQESSVEVICSTHALSQRIAGPGWISSCISGIISMGRSMVRIPRRSAAGIGRFVDRSRIVVLRIANQKAIADRDGTVGG